MMQRSQLQGLCGTVILYVDLPNKRTTSYGHIAHHLKPASIGIALIVG